MITSMGLPADAPDLPEGSGAAVGFGHDKHCERCPLGFVDPNLPSGLRADLERLQPVRRKGVAMKSSMSFSGAHAKASADR
ncbi:hypothetical protein OG455_10565 [Kitasatospora sp. NBC_01287]|uniref:hypothetical protein n=1 Tax=Kitasatospora sp. NBC_01287 TaxID=2903573 RepID=UPI0022598842|nr:hypothetical protein [Kitasatospora sp. NBC_01287]MCX4745963.1 hypothetical protein [Kitasatospora sp. NBC_01287]